MLNKEGKKTYFLLPECFFMFDKKFLISVLTCILFCFVLDTEVEAVRPPLMPLNIEKFREMIADAELIAIGTVASVKFSKTLQPPRETVLTHVTLKPEKILKGNKAMNTIEIEETYQQFSMDDMGKAVTAKKTGPAPPVGRYQEGTRIAVFLQPIVGSKQYRPVGSGSHDAYLGVLQITPGGVKSDRYQFDEIVSGHTTSETGFINFIISLKRGCK
jgi:hypothetical protein